MPKINIYGALIASGYSLLSAVSPYRAWKYHKLLLRNQYLPAEELRKLQWLRFRKIVQHAYVNVPFYNAKFRQAGIHPDEIKTPDDIHNIPFTERKELSQAPGFDVIATGYSRKDLVLIQTSGTSNGIPFRLYIDKDALNRKYALLLRNYSFFNWQFGKKVMALWNKSHEDYKPLSQRSLLKAFVYRFVHRKKLLPPFQEGCSLSLHQGHNYFRRIKRYKPHLLEADGFMVYHIGKFFEKNRLDLPPIEAISSATCPTTPAIRKRISEIWNTEVFNNYGPHEMEGVACECSAHKGLHQSIDSYLIEFIDGNTPASDNELSEVVLTDFDNYAMPLIRYKLGDVVRAGTSSCTCGRTLPLMNDIEGRKVDLLKTQKGMLTENDLQDFFGNFDMENHFQIVQRSQNGFDVSVVSSKDCTPNLLADLEKELRGFLGKESTIRMKTVDAISCEPSGKFRPVKCEVS